MYRVFEHNQVLNMKLLCNLTSCTVTIRIDYCFDSTEINYLVANLIYTLYSKRNERRDCPVLKYVRKGCSNLSIHFQFGVVYLRNGERGEPVQGGQFHTRNRGHVPVTWHRLRIFCRFTFTNVRLVGGKIALDMENSFQVLFHLITSLR